MPHFDPSSFVSRSAGLTLVLGAETAARETYAEQLAAATGARLARVIAGHASAASEVADLVAALEGTQPAARAVVPVPGDVDVTHVIGAASDVAGDATVVTVVDATSIISRLGRQTYLDRAAPDGPELVAEAAITVQHLEFAELVLVVDHERVPTGRLTRLTALLSHLNPTARIVLRGSTVVVPATRRGRTPYGDRPGWVRALNDEHDPVFTDPDVRTFRYEQPRPFHTGRLMHLLEGDLSGHRYGTLVRSAGFCRFATRPGRAALWEQVGSMITFDPLAADEASPELASTGQDLVFTGIRLHRAGLTAALDACVLSDRELLEGPGAWVRIPDPLPRWVEA